MERSFWGGWPFNIFNHHKKKRNETENGSERFDSNRKRMTESVRGIERTRDRRIKKRFKKICRTREQIVCGRIYNRQRGKGATYWAYRKCMFQVVVIVVIDVFVATTATQWWFSAFSFVFFLEFSFGDNERVFLFLILAFHSFIHAFRFDFVDSDWE